MKGIKIFDSLEEGMRIVPDKGTRLVMVDNKPICFIRQGEKFYAIEDNCPHLGFSLAKGNLNVDNEIVCPWHSYRFNVKTGEESALRCRKAKTYKVALEDGKVLLQI